MFEINSNKANSILFVDDEIRVLNALRRSLVGEDYKCVFATSGKEALEIMKNQFFNVIVTDMKMPNMDGLSLLKIVKENYPDTIRIVLSGYTQFTQLMTTINQAEIFKFIAKPWDIENEFKPIMRQSIDYSVYLLQSKQSKEYLKQKNLMYKNIIKASDNIVKKYQIDFDTSKIISSNVFKYIENRFFTNSESTTDNKKYFLWVKNTINNYFESKPTKIKNFNINSLIDDIKNIFIQKHSLELSILFSKDSKVDLHSDYNLILYSIESILEFYYVIESKNPDTILIDSIDKNIIIKLPLTTILNTTFNLEYELLKNILNSSSIKITIDSDKEYLNFKIIT